MRTQKIRCRGNTLRLALAALLAWSAGLPVARALPLGNPIQGDPALFLDDPRLTQLSESQGDYSVRFTRFDTSRFRNASGGILGVTAEITLHEVGEGDQLPSSSFARSLLVLTSVRLGAAPAGGPTCPIADSLPLANAGFVLDGFGGDPSGPALLVGDHPQGRVCDGEGDVFLGVPLAGAAGAAQQVDFQIQLGATLPSLAFFLQYQAYSVNPLPVPEAGAGALLLAGMGALALWRRRRPPALGRGSVHTVRRVC